MTRLSISGSWFFVCSFHSPKLDLWNQRNSGFISHKQPTVGYIDVGAKRMLMTLSWWQFLDVSDRILILVTSFGCWCLTLLLKDRGGWWQKRAKLSPTSQSCQQHISSPKSVTSIDATDLMSRRTPHGIFRPISEYEIPEYGP